MNYHDRPEVSKTQLDWLAESPATYLFKKKYPDKQTKSMEIGTAVHMRVLEPRRYSETYRIAPDLRCSEAKRLKKDGFTVINQADAAIVDGCAESLMAHPKVAKLLAMPGEAEKEFYAVDPETGVGIRCKFDWITDCGIAMDLKAVSDPTMPSFGYHMRDYRYHVQQAFYSHVYKQATGREIQAWVFAAVGTKPPHLTGLYVVSEAMLQKATILYQNELALYKKCVDTGVYEGLTTEIQEVDL